MAEWYEVYRPTSAIKKVDVKKETDSSVWVDGARKSKISDWYAYFTTYKMAYLFCVNKLSEKIEFAKSQLDHCESQLDRFYKNNPKPESEETK